MRAFVLIIVLLFGSPAVGQQLKEITNSIGMRLVLIHAGSFTMGSPVNELEVRPDETPHEVKISKSYYLGIYEVTQEQYDKVMGHNPSAFQGAKNPVETVSWNEAVSFCKRLSSGPDEKLAGRVYRLPTEAEWEYACRAKNTTSYCFGDKAESLEEYAWFGEGRGGSEHPVGEKKANSWGLYDMHGNVWEWCQDWYGNYPAGDATDPNGPSEGTSRVYRGGSWNGLAAHCRSAHRSSNDPLRRSYSLGFRVALSLNVK